MSCFFPCVSKTINDVILIPNHNIDIQREPDVQKEEDIKQNREKEIQKIFEDVKNYTPLSKKQLLLIETIDMKKIIEIIKIQNNCLDTLSSLMT